jgi:1-acyl-sn-glycerol-3-phosphate acyltransferase
VSFGFLYFCGYWVARLGSKVLFNPIVRGQEHIPASGGFLLASNHISYYDPPLVGSWQRREMFFLAKKELFQNKLLGGAISRTNALPVSRGSVDRQAIKMAVEAINNGYGLVFFPEGTRSRTQEFLKPKPGIGVIATLTGCAIVPTYIHGTNRLKDCFLRRDRMSITYGEPIEAEWVQSQPKSREGYQAIADTVMARIAQLKAQVSDIK